MLRRRTVLQGALAGAVLSGCSTGSSDTRPTESPGNPFNVDGNAAVDVVVSEEYGGFAASAYRKKYAKAQVTPQVSAKLSDAMLPARERTDKDLRRRAPFALRSDWGVRVMEWLAVLFVFLVLCALLYALLPHEPWRFHRRLLSPFMRLVRRRNKEILPEPDPFDTLRLQTRLGHLAEKIALVEATPHIYAKAHKLMALEAAYDDLLDEACRLAGIPGEAGLERGEEKRWHEEQELTSRGWSW